MEYTVNVQFFGCHPQTLANIDENQAIRIDKNQEVAFANFEYSQANLYQLLIGSHPVVTQKIDGWFFVSIPTLGRECWTCDQTEKGALLALVEVKKQVILRAAKNGRYIPSAPIQA